MPLTPRRLNRATLARQLLLRREPLGVEAAVRRVVAVQAQHPASPYIALWNRVEGFDAAELDRAFADHTIIKATAVRITLHAMHATDYPVIHEAMQPTLRGSRLGDRRFTAASLSIGEIDALVPEVLAYAAVPRSNPEVEAWLGERLGVGPRPGVWWAMRTYAPFVHAPTGAPWSFGPRPAYLAAPHGPRSGDAGASLRHLVTRYLEGFGPASVQDIARFALVQRSRVREAADALGDALVRVDGSDGVQLLDVPGAPLPPEDAPAPPRLMAMWDSTLLAYADRGRMMPPEYRQHVTRTNGDVLPTLLVDGRVAGVWRPVEDGIEATAFAPLPKDAWVALDAEARRLIAFLAPREPGVYRQYGRWWSTLPEGEVRVLGR